MAEIPLPLLIAPRKPATNEIMKMFDGSFDIDAWCIEAKHRIAQALGFAGFEVEQALAVVGQAA